MYELDCPYCDHVFNADLEGEQYEEDYLSKTECPECEKYFTFVTRTSISLHPSKADCLNGAPHKWEPACKWPLYKSVVRFYSCEDCDERKRFSIEQVKDMGLEYTAEWKKFDEEQEK